MEARPGAIPSKMRMIINGMPGWAVNLLLEEAISVEPYRLPEYEAARGWDIISYRRMISYAAGEDKCFFNPSQVLI